MLLFGSFVLPGKSNIALYYYELFINESLQLYFDNFECVMHFN
jgi:hypothetical protein